MTTPEPGAAATGRDIRSQLRLIHAAADYLADFEEQDRTMILEMSQDMLAAVIECRDLEPMAHYVAHYCSVLDVPGEAEQFAAAIEAAATGQE